MKMCFANLVNSPKIHRGEECMMMSMSIIYAHDSVAYNFVNIIMPNNDKINHLVLHSTETHERSFLFSCKTANTVHA